MDFLVKGHYKLVELADDPNRNDAFVRAERVGGGEDTLTLPLRADGGHAG